MQSFIVSIISYFLILFVFKLSEVFESEIDPVMQSLGYCCGRKYVFQPQILCCFGKMFEVHVGTRVEGLKPKKLVRVVYVWPARGAGGGGGGKKIQIFFGGKMDGAF